MVEIFGWKLFSNSFKFEDWAWNNDDDIDQNGIYINSKLFTRIN